MIEQIRYIWQLLALSLFLVLLGILAIPRLGIDLALNHYLITLISIAGINFLAWFVMARGMKKSSREGVVVLLAGIGIKFLLYLMYILVFWLVTKNLTKPFIIAFFALYLVFTFLLARNLLKAQNNK